MNTKFLLETNGDPLGAIQNLFIEAWERFELDSMMVPGNGSSAPHLLSEPEQLKQMNPFKPLMTSNAAKFIPKIINENSKGRIGAVLRPCEVRALEAKTEREEIPSERMLTIGIDCLGTYLPEDYQWRVEKKGSPARLNGETLQFARQGGIAAYRFRSACQACQTPVGTGADINVGVIGLPVRQRILIDIPDQVTAETLGGERATSPEDTSIYEQRDYIIARLLQRGTQTRQRLVDSLESILPRNLDALISQFERCGECRACFDNCPLCATDYPVKDSYGLYEREQVKQWMISCAGCGMCQQACPNHLPLVTIFTQIRQQLIDSIEVPLIN
jgi:formate dehydrogenase subunit beta